METRLLCVIPAGIPSGSVLRCSGEIDLSNVEEFRRALARSLWTGLVDVDVDLVQITFLDSSAIHALLEAQRELARRSGRLRVVGGPHSAKLLRALGLDDLLLLTEVATGERVLMDRAAPSGKAA